MVTQIQLGNFFSQNGKTVVSGGASGIDIEGLINSLAAAKRQPAVVLEGKIETNVQRAEAFNEYQTLLDDFKTASDFLRNPPGVNNASDNIFEYRASSVLSNTAIPGSTYMSVTAEPGTPIGEYDITIDNLATRNVKTTDSFLLTDADQSIVGSGGIMNAGILALGPNSINVTFEDGDSLNQVVAKINAVKDSSKVEASFIRVADGEYRLSLKTTETGTDMNYDLGTGVLPSGQIFHYDATDINGDGSSADNPATDSNMNGVAWFDSITNSGATESGGGAPTLDVDGMNGKAAMDFSGATSSLFIPANAGNINTSGPFEQKTFAFSIKTGADVSGTQTIYEQGGAGRSMGVFIAPDPANGNEPTLFATMHNGTEWVGTDQWKTVNMGVVTADTDYNIVVEFDASANPTTHDPANTLKGYVNGTLMDTVTGVKQQYNHSGAIGIGASTNGVGFPNETTSNSTTAFYSGSIGEIVGTNSILTDAERTDLDKYLFNKWQNPIPMVDIFNVGFAIQEDAIDAQMTIDGTTVTRDSNNFSDVIDGMTFSLEQETPPGTELAVDIEPNKELAKQGIVNFVDAYNALRVFSAEQGEVDEGGTPIETAVLSGNSTLRLTETRISNEISGIINGLGGDVDTFTRLSQIGITVTDFGGDSETPETKNILTIDETVLDSAINTDYQGVRDIFEFSYTSDNIDLQIFSRTNGLGINDFSLNIDLTNQIFEATYDDNGTPTTIALEAVIQDNGTTVQADGSTILVGIAGTVLEGLTMIYSSSTDATVNIHASQGFGDRMYNTITELLTEGTGAVATAISAIEDEDTRYTKDITNIDAQVERLRESLLRKFSALESAISSANILLESLDAQANARNQ